VDASDCLDLLLPQSISVFAFDFSGSGLSDGETISLGFYEQDDLMAVIEYLRSR
jgi:alpha/beta superfamily hydrolase